MAGAVTSLVIQGSPIKLDVDVAEEILKIVAEDTISVQHIVQLRTRAGSDSFTYRVFVRHVEGSFVQAKVKRQGWDYPIMVRLWRDTPRKRGGEEFMQAGKYSTNTRVRWDGDRWPKRPRADSSDDNQDEIY